MALGLVEQLRARDDTTFVIAISSHEAGNQKLEEAGANVTCQMTRWLQSQSPFVMPHSLT